MIMKDRLDFLPVNPEDVRARNWSEVDFVYVTGDAYVDHPSFGASIISRVLEAEGFRVAILSQPDYKSPEDFKRFGSESRGFQALRQAQTWLPCHRRKYRLDGCALYGVEEAPFL